MVTSSATLTAILLTERSVPSDAPPLSAAEFWPLVRRIDVDKLPDQGLPEALEFGHPRVVDQERLDALLARGTAMAFELDRLTQSGITVLSALDVSYPDRLRGWLP